MRSAWHWLLFISFLFILSACGEPPESDTVLNTPIDNAIVDESATVNAEETAVIEMVVVDDTAVPAPTLDATVVSEEAPPPPPPTVVVEDAPPPPAPPAQEPKPFEITQLVPQLVGGGTATVAGTAPTAGGEVTVELWAGPHLLAESTTTVNENGDWRVELPVPLTVHGAARVRAVSLNETAVRPLELLPSEDDPLDVAVMGAQPLPEDTAVAGAPLFFAGNVTNAINRTITISFWINDCTESVATQSVTLDGSAVYWNALIILPPFLDAEQGCASISTGDSTTGTWREEIIPLRVIQMEDDAAQGLITLGNRPDEPFKAGSTIYLYGSALNIPDTTMTISWVGEGENAAFLNTAVEVDSFGYWDTDITIPAELVGQTTMTFTSGTGDEATTAEVTIPVNP